ncbi:MAG: hypothetical protein L0241_05530 [Planctomycetia bacterium]|nr:hypothetical protein [Planctomycetia bacterium]
MGSLPIADWPTTLDRMDTALASALKSLERAEERWEMAVAPSAGDGERPLALDRIDTRLSESETRLIAARELVESAERELAERNTAIENWLRLFARWEDRLRR